MRKSFLDMTKEEFESYMVETSKEIEALYGDFVCIKDNDDDLFGGKVGDLSRFLKTSFDGDFLEKRDKFWVKVK